MSGLLNATAPSHHPTAFEWDEGFWQAARQGRLVVQSCAACGKRRHLPRLMCPACGSLDFSWSDCSGRGTIYSWTEVRRSFHPSFADVPFVLALVALDEFPDVHFVTRIEAADVPAGGLRIDAPVELFFDELSAEITLPRFRPVR